MGIYDIDVTTIAGESQKLGAYRGKTLLIVNVASQCGFTPQYAGLEQLYRAYRSHGLEVLGFPCDQFGHQEPGTEAEIQTFCSTEFDVSFPMFAKVDVNGAHEHPLYHVLKTKRRGVLGSGAIKWNFTKFLVSPEGEVLKRYAPQDTPEHIRRELESVLRSASSPESPSP